MNSSRARRRVPDQLRKRAAVSCDFCKVRRRKCVRSTSQTSCELCLENSVECVSTIPRQPRSQLPSDEPSQLPSDEPRPQAAHTKALEDLVSKLFPGIDTNNTDHIFKLSQDIDAGNTALPCGHSESPWSASGAANASQVASSGTTLEPQQAASSHLDPAQVPVGQPKTSPTTSFYERLLPNPYGTLSYFGASSSMAYVRKMRELLAAGERSDSNANLDSSQSLRTTFIQDKHAYTMGEDQGTVPELPAVDYTHLEGQRPLEQASSRLLKLLETLPPKEETEDLVEHFFAHVHINIALFHRSSFQAVLDRLRSSDTNAVDVGWAVCVRLAVAFGCEWLLSTMTPRGGTKWERLISLKRQLISDSFSDIPHLMLSGSLQSVTALALCAVYMSFANERNAAWVLSGCSIRMAIGLGLHRGENVVQRSDIATTPLEKELRKLIWCSLYMFEQYTSALFGRPSSVDGADIIIDLPKESILDQGFYWPPGYLQHDISLARLIGKIREVQLNQGLSATNDSQGLPDVSSCQRLLHELDDWRSDLPSFLEFDETQLDRIYPSHLRQILMIHVRYQYARILLSRPFLLKALYISHALKPAMEVNPQIVEYKSICFQAALDTWAIIHCLWKIGQYNANLSLDGVFAYQCNLILSLYLLDVSKTSDTGQVRKLQEMVKQIQDILQKGPGNRTMRRLVQISRDFSEIVSSTSPEHDMKDTIPTLQTNQSDNAKSTPSGVSYPPPLNPTVTWECIMESTMFHGDFMDGTFMFDPSADLAFDQIEFHGL